MSTANTPERGLIRTVALVNRAAHVARLRGVTRVNQHHWNTAHLSFIADVRPKLHPVGTRRPIAVSASLRFPNRLLRALANVGQIFKGKRALSAFGFRNKLLGNEVVGVRLKAALFAADGSQASFGILRTDGLQPITTTLIPLAYPFHLSTAVLLTVAIRRKVHNPEVNTQRRVNIFGGWFVNIARDQEVELAFTKNKITFALSRVQHLALTFTTHKRHVFEATVNRPNRNCQLITVERQDAIIVGNTAVWPVATRCLAIQLVAIAHFGKTANHHLCRQAIVRLDLLIHQLLQIVLPKDLLVPGHATDLVARGVRRFKRARERSSLLGRGLQLDLGDDFHI